MPASRCSSWSRRNAIDSREKSPPGRVTLTRASSSGSRGSPPWRWSSTATASRSQSRSTVGSGSWFACSRSRSRVSSVMGSESGTSPMCWTSSRWRRCSSRSVTRRARSCPCSASSSMKTSAPAVSPSTTASQMRKSASSSTAPSSWRTDGTSMTLFVADGELVEGRFGVAEGASSAARDQRERRVGCLDPLGVADAPQDAHELLQARPREDEGLAARAHGRQHLREVGRAEDEDQVGRRLLDQLQERVPGGVRELVRLVEDVDLVAALGGLEDDALADLADVVDPALRGRVHLDHVERGAVRDRDAGVADLVGRRRRPLLAVDAPSRGSAPSTSCRCRAGRRRGRPGGAGRARSRSAASARPLPARPRRRSPAAGTCGRARSPVDLSPVTRSVFERPPRGALASPAPARRDRGTWEGILSAASFRT